MKKVLALVLAAVMLLSVVLTGCQTGDSQATTGTTTQPSTTKPVEIIPIPEGAAVTNYYKVSDYSALALPTVDGIVPGDFCIALNGAAKATIVIAADAEAKEHILGAEVVRDEIHRRHPHQNQRQQRCNGDHAPANPL